MKTVCLSFLCLIVSQCAIAGKPIIMDKAEACQAAEIVVIAQVSDAAEIEATTDPFAPNPLLQQGFSTHAKATVLKTLIDHCDPEIEIYGGRAGLGTLYRLASGHHLLLLTPVKGGGFRATDYHHSFMPIEAEKVSWLVDRFSKQRETISIDEALHRIRRYRLSTEN